MENSLHKAVFHFLRCEFMIALCEATCTWSGELPKRTLKSSGYSSKVFLGGVPWDATESLLMSTFKQFGPIRVEWPGKSMDESDDQPKGYAYIIFESEKQVSFLIVDKIYILFEFLLFNNQISWCRWNLCFLAVPIVSVTKRAGTIELHRSDRSLRT